MSRETAVKSESMFGSKLYQERARIALPILVRQAGAGETLYYQDLANELGMPNPRNLNYVLGAVGQTLLDLAHRWAEDVPPIQCLVVSQRDQQPGAGFGWFMSAADWQNLSKQQRARVLRSTMQQVYGYPKWDSVLSALQLAPAIADIDEILARAATPRGGGESEDHRRLKEHIRANPTTVGLPRRAFVAATEYHLPSGDCVDVFFDYGDEWVAVEVKSGLSDEGDLARGLFQCVKYRAVLQALAAVRQADVVVRTVLALGRDLPRSLVPLKHTLGIQVIDDISVPQVVWP